MLVFSLVFFRTFCGLREHNKKLEKQKAVQKMCQFHTISVLLTWDSSNALTRQHYSAATKKCALEKQKFLSVTFKWYALDLVAVVWKSIMHLWLSAECQSRELTWQGRQKSVIFFSISLSVFLSTNLRFHGKSKIASRICEYLKETFWFWSSERSDMNSRLFFKLL